LPRSLTLLAPPLAITWWAASGAAGRVSLGAMVVATPGLLSLAVGLLKARSIQTTVLIEAGI
jgi:hypothetical protein